MQIAKARGAHVTGTAARAKHDFVRAWREQRRRQFSQRIHVEHTDAEYKRWRPLQRFTGRRGTYAETHLAIAGLVSDRSARRPTRRRSSTELVLARQAAY